MSWDVLLHWMTHVSEGSWTVFRNAVAKLADSDADVDSLCRRLRIGLSDLAHADFFVQGSRRWRALPTVLAGLPSSSGAAVLSGGRTPKLVARLAEAARARQCRLVAEEDEDLPLRVRVEGPEDALTAVAADAGIAYVRYYAAALCREVVPIPFQLENAPAEPAPGNWSVRSFDFRSLTWVDGLRARSACEYRPRYGDPRFYVHTRRGKLLRIPRREAVYAAAMLQGVTLAEYDWAAARLSTPAAAPLPVAYARAACLCAGAPARFERGRLLYEKVPQETAALLIVAAGQRYPRPPQPAAATAAATERRHGQPV